MLVVLGGIYAFYLMETIFSLITKSHEHHHEVKTAGGSFPVRANLLLCDLIRPELGPLLLPLLTPQEESEPHHCDHGKVLEMYQQEKKRKATQSTSELVRDADPRKKKNKVVRIPEKSRVPKRRSNI